MTTLTTASLSVLTAISPGEPGLASTECLHSGFYRSYDDAGDCENRSYTMQSSSEIVPHQLTCGFCLRATSSVARLLQRHTPVLYRNG